MADTSLGEYEGKPIRKMAIEVRNTAGGLNAAIKVDPARIHPGEQRIVAYEVDFDKFRFDPMDDGDAWCLVAIGRATTAAFVDPSVVRASIEAARDAAKQIADEKKGQGAFSPDADGVAMKLSTDHAAGLHVRKRKACPDCNPPGEEEPTGATPIGRAKGASKRARKRV